MTKCHKKAAAARKPVAMVSVLVIFSPFDVHNNKNNDRVNDKKKGSNSTNNNISLYSHRHNGVAINHRVNVA